MDLIDRHDTYCYVDFFFFYLILFILNLSNLDIW